MRVTAVVVHWRNPEETLGCVESLATEPVDVIVVENGTQAPVAERLAARMPAVTCIRSSENRGYAGGANLGIRAACDRGAEIVLVLNDDVRVRVGATAAATELLAGDDRIAAVGPKVLSREDPNRLWLAWGCVTYHQSLVALCGAGAADGPPFDTGRDVEWIAGCAMWLRAAALARVGLFDEDFFAYHEEVDWCTRARAAGWRVVYCPTAVVTHAGRGHRGGPAAVRVRKYFAARNAIVFARKHASGPQRLKLAAFLATTLPLELLWHAPRGDAGEVVAKLCGIRDALLRRRPPFEALGLR